MDLGIRIVVVIEVEGVVSLRIRIDQTGSSMLKSETPDIIMEEEQRTLWPHFSSLLSRTQLPLHLQYLVEIPN